MGQPVAPVGPPLLPNNLPEFETVHTVAESSKWTSTSTSEQVVGLLNEVSRLSPGTSTRLSMGRTLEDREMPVIVLSDPAVGSAAEARALADREGRVIVLLFGNIHAGEVDAKEAYMMLAREFALRNHPQRPKDYDDLLKQLIVCIAPNYNADGNDKMNAIDINRPGQNGPSGGAGMRHNAMDRDLNRDWGKLDTPEARNIVRFINEWNPHVIVDGHTTNGSWHRYLLTYAGPKVPAGDPELIRWTRDEFFAQFDAAMAVNHQIDTFFYGDFDGEYAQQPKDQSRSHEKWETFPAQARYSTGYLGLRGHIGILSESYAYSTYRDRIIGSRAFALEVLRLSAQHRAHIRKLVADAALDGAGKGVHAGRSIAIRGQHAMAPGKTIVKGYVEALRNGRWLSTGEPHDYEVEVWNRYDAQQMVERPAAYAFLEPAPNVIENLRMHGIAVTALDKGMTVDGEVYTIDHVSNVSRMWQGHLLVSVEATPTPQRLDLPEGTMIVRTDQPLGTLAVYLLEPECEDGLTTWNFFDAWLAPSERFPVARVLRLDAMAVP